MDWRVKGVVQKALSLVPGGTRANDLLQRTVGSLRHLEREIDAKVNADWVVLLGHMTELGMSPEGLEYLEVGTGWYPTLPICYALAGARRCLTFDLTRHLDPRHTARLVAALRGHLPAIARASHRSLSDVERDYDELARARTLEQILRRARVEYHAPADASRTHLPPASVDVVFSNSVLEHIPGDVILRIMEESARVLRPGGVAIHSVNCGDHYAYFDKSITQINYLQFSEREWALWNNDLQYQNRLRPQDLLDLAEKAGLEVILKKHTAKPKLLEQVARMKIAPEFRRYPPEQLACTSIDFVARKAAK